MPVLAAVWTALGKTPAFTLMFAVTLGALLTVALVNKEPVAVQIAFVATAYYSGGGWKNWSDQKYAQPVAGSSLPPLP